MVWFESLPRNVNHESRTACSTTCSTGRPSACSTSIRESTSDFGWALAASTSTTSGSPARAANRTQSASPGAAIEPFTATGTGTSAASRGASLGSASATSCGFSLPDDCAIALATGGAAEGMAEAPPGGVARPTRSIRPSIRPSQKPPSAGTTAATRSACLGSSPTSVRSGTLQAFTLRSSAAVTSRLPSGESATATIGVSWANRACTGGLIAGASSDASFQRWIRLSRPAASTCLPSGVNATLASSPCGWLSVSSRTPSLARQSFTVSSALAEPRSLPDGCQARSNTAPLWTSIDRTRVPSATFQSLIERS